jgi:hypothetical protein
LPLEHLVIRLRSWFAGGEARTELDAQLARVVGQTAALVIGQRIAEHCHGIPAVAVNHIVLKIGGTLEEGRRGAAGNREGCTYVKRKFSHVLVLLGVNLERPNLARRLRFAFQSLL